MSNKEELNEANEILYGSKKTPKSVTAVVSAEKPEKVKTSGDELVEEILYGKKPKSAKEPKAKTEAEELTDEILYGKKKPKKSSETETTDADDLVDEIIHGKKKSKKPAEASAETGDTPKKKKFNRDDYFGL